MKAKTGAKRPRILPGHAKNFDTMLRAAADGALALMLCTDKASGKPVTVVCMVSRPDGPEGEYVMVPVAKMFDGNPYDEVLPPEGR